MTTLFVVSQLMIWGSRLFDLSIDVRFVGYIFFLAWLILAITNAICRELYPPKKQVYRILFPYE